MRASPKSCLMSGCKNKVTTRGFCSTHYQRGKRNGTIKKLAPPIYNIPEWVTEADLSYAAGFIDADGSILIGKTSKKYPHRFRAVVNAVGVDIKVLEFLHSIFGGKVRLHRKTGVGERNYTLNLYCWQVTDARAISTARYLFPFLKIKSRQAHNLIKFKDEAIWYQGGGNLGTPSEEIKRRIELVNETKSLNNRNYLRGEICETQI